MSTSVHTDADLDEEAMDSDYDDNQSNSESEDDDLWSNAISKHFENLHPVSSSNPEVTALMNSTDNARSYFDTIFDADICAHIVEQTNLYIAQKMGETGRNSQNFEFAVEDLYAWIGLLILMGIHQLPELRHYWSSEPLLGLPVIKAVMTSKRYKKIVEVIHCNDNTSNPARGEQGHDKLHKLRPVIDKLNRNCSYVYKPSGTVSVDESMIPFKGRSSLKQYMPMKPIKRRYKVWCLGDSVTGYILAFDIYTGKSNAMSSDGYGLGEKVVLNLCNQVVLDSWTVVAFDNFFTTIRLMEDLYKKQLFSVGTVRVHRKGLPEMMKKNMKMKRGEFSFQTKGCVCAFKWMDSKAVTALATTYSPKEISKVNRRAKDGTLDSVSCPLAIAEYNRIMGGIDRFDQMRERYAIGRRSLKWWHRIFYWLIDLSVVNAFTLYKLNRRHVDPVDQLTFRLQLIRQLTNGYTNRPKRGRPVSFLANKRRVPDDVRLNQVGDHMPKQNKTYRRCRLCSTTQREKRTRYVCTACDVPLCLEPCFRQFHGK